MPIYELTSDAIVELPDARFGDHGVRERDDLQRLLRDKIEVIDPDVLVVAEEFGGAGEWDGSKRRIDLLGVDRQANLVVLELKRDESGGHMELQAIRYAAMVSTMTFEQVVDAYATFLKEPAGRAEERLLEWLGWETPEDAPFGQDVRVVLVSAAFSKEVMTSVLWLNERQLDIRCVRLRPQGDGKRLFLEIQQIVPLPEASDYLIGVRKKAAEERVKIKVGEWEGDWYVNLGMDHPDDPATRADGSGNLRHWEHCHRHGYVAAGGGERYSQSLVKLGVGDPLYVYQRGLGYLGFGRVTQAAAPAHELRVSGNQSAAEAAGDAHVNERSDPEQWEWAVGVEWKRTVPLDEAITFPGVFANQNVVCKLRDAGTLEILRDRFGGEPVA